MAVPVPALVVDVDALDHNIRTIGETLPGPRLRPHVKAFKSTALARRLADAPFLGGLNICGGMLTEQHVAEAQGLAYVPPAEALAKVYA